MGEKTQLPVRDTLPNQPMHISESLEDLQTTEQRRILDTIAQVRKCGLDSILSLPQLVVCGDQSAGKSSVLEALTEIPFPRNDNLCTRFATEIILRRSPMDSLTIKIIPDEGRPITEQTSLRSFKELITNLQELPRVMNMATDAMGMKLVADNNSQIAAFSRDVLSIEIEGPSRPQLTLVDIPGLIANATKGVTDADVQMVAEITDRYISLPRTICLAVISATNDHANQPILTKVRKYDPEGDRTLGIITKPDRLPAGSGSEKAFISLAKNEDVFFKLGWHVLKNRSFEDGDSSLTERNMAERTFFRTSNFKVLPVGYTGIDKLRERLSLLLFDHVKQELPKLRLDLENALSDTKQQLHIMGSRRSTPVDCRAYLTKLSLDIYEICKAAVNGHYEGEYFHRAIAKDEIDNESPIDISRIRAVVQNLNTEFSDFFRKKAHKYHIDFETDCPRQVDADSTDGEDLDSTEEVDLNSIESIDHFPTSVTPIGISKDDALRWVARAQARTRGRELVGNYNPLLVGELFWEQSTKWKLLSADHIDRVARQCSQFLKTLLHEKCPRDVEKRLWDGKIHDSLKERSQKANDELTKIIEDAAEYPINYNHYYTDTIKSRRQNRQQAILTDSVNNATENISVGRWDAESRTRLVKNVDVEKVMATLAKNSEQNMETFGCEEVLDCLLAIYKVQQKTFIANITTQVIERHVVRGLEKIFSPVVVNSMSDTEVEAIASEPVSAKRQREYLEDRIKKLQDGHDIFRNAMGGGGN